MDGKRNAARTGAAALILAGLNGVAAAQVTVGITPDRQSLGKNDDVHVTVTLSNRTATMQYLLAWQTPLAGVQAPLFDITRTASPSPISASRPSAAPRPPLITSHWRPAPAAASGSNCPDSTT